MSLNCWGTIGVGLLAVAFTVRPVPRGKRIVLARAQALVAQPTLSSPVVSVRADAPCVASLVADGGVDVEVTVIENINTATGSCQVHETLADGTVLIAVFEFARNGSGCCADSTHAVAPAPMFTQGNEGTP